MKRFILASQFKLYDLIFPFWLMLFIPPVIFLTLIGNFVIDLIILYLVLRTNKISLQSKQFWSFVVKSWAFGLLADICAAILLFVINLNMKLSDYTIYDSPKTILMYLLAVIFGGILVFIFNYMLCRRLQFQREHCFRISIIMGILTAPWTFLIPTTLFGF